MFSIDFNTESSEETFHLGERLGEVLEFPCVIFLYGGMGLGKTLFSKGIVSGMGIEEDVTSPTYTVVNVYGDPPKVFHFDLYRLQDTQELYEMGFEDYLDQGAVVIIEWPDLACSYNFEDKLDVWIEPIQDNLEKRHIIFKTESSKLCVPLNKL
ncbi:MAG: tRNA (adenosine(37)-N6)-threonylcarbamoyltransferase complex ATPase subunit type 1 TsaE [Eubacteriaceae bacterium]